MNYEREKMWAAETKRLRSLAEGLAEALRKATVALEREAGLHRQRGYGGDGLRSSQEAGAARSALERYGHAVAPKRVFFSTAETPETWDE